VAPCFFGLICWFAFAAEAVIARESLARIREMAPQAAAG